MVLKRTLMLAGALGAAASKTSLAGPQRRTRTGLTGPYSGLTTYRRTLWVRKGFESPRSRT